MKTTLGIQNLKCGGCEQTINTKLATVPGVSEVIVNVEDSTVSFEYENPSTLKTVEETLSRLGYPVDGAMNSIHKKAISYVSCALGRLK